MTIGYMICGSTGAGKTTYARAMAKKERIQVFSIDEWMQTLFWMDAPEGGDLEWALARVRRCEEQIWLLARRLLNDGYSVVLDLGFSKAEQRKRFETRFRESGHHSELHFLDIPLEIRRTRVEKRNLEKSETFAFEVDRAMFDWMESYFERPDERELEAAVVTRS